MAKTTSLFWNLNRKPLLNLVVSLVREHDVRVLMLAECLIPIDDLLIGLNQGEYLRFIWANLNSRSVKILIRLPRTSIQPIDDSGRVTIQRLAPPIGTEIILVAAHLRSKLHQTSEDQAMSCTQIIQYVEAAETSVGHSRTIVCGDFNMNPFDWGMIGGTGFHAVMSRRVAEKRQRGVQGEERRFFYNPMWSLLGDASKGPPGTYFL